MSAVQDRDDAAKILAYSIGVENVVVRTDDLTGTGRSDTQNEQAFRFRFSRGDRGNDTLSGAVIPVAAGATDDDSLRYGGMLVGNNAPVGSTNDGVVGEPLRPFSQGTWRDCGKLMPESAIIDVAGVKHIEHSARGGDPRLFGNREGV